MATTYDHFATIVRKGFNTGTNRNTTDKARADRTATLIATMEKAIAPQQDRLYAEAQFEGTGTKETPFVVYTTKIFPSGGYHCNCPAFKRDGGTRQARPCKHATALARIVLHDGGKTCEGFNDPRIA